MSIPFFAENGSGDKISFSDLSLKIGNDASVNFFSKLR